ncbi:hypothetical protein Tco_0751219 [Tanacetum coccineum]|uniref:Uncharacterized protein n=1 Tax=Tanacetum coccineum TaxID=301880 RepID=A0ABQ4Z6V8_9ASTR
MRRCRTETEMISMKVDVGLNEISPRTIESGSGSVMTMRMKQRFITAIEKRLTRSEGSYRIVYEDLLVARRIRDFDYWLTQPEQRERASSLQ